MTLRGLYGYMTALTRPIRYMEETRGGESCAADRDATNLVTITSALTRPVTIQPKNRGRGGQIVGLVGQCTEWCLFSLWLGLFETVNPFPFVPICCIIKQKRLIVIGGSS